MKDELSIQMQSAHGSVPMRFIPGVYSAGRNAILKEQLFRNKSDIYRLIISYSTFLCLQESLSGITGNPGIIAGILLWQFIGEISWHYSIGGVHFVPFESVTTFPIACLFILLLVYGKKHHSFDRGIWCMLLSFAFNVPNRTLSFCIQNARTCKAPFLKRSRELD
jgi:hypothetical protein